MWCPLRDYIFDHGKNKDYYIAGIIREEWKEMNVNLPFVVRINFFGSLMFVYTHIAAVSPCIDNIEGYVYFKKE